VGTEPLFLARESGLFDGSIHLAEYLNSEHELRAFHNGVIDAAAVTLEEVLNLDHLGQQAQVVLVMDASQGADCVVARPEVKSLAELRGRRVASEDVMLPTYMLHRALGQVGLRPEDVQRVFQGPDQLEGALRRGEVDAAVAYEPYCHRLVAAGGHVLFDSSQIPQEIVDVLVVRRRFLQENPAQVDVLLRGWFAALDLLRQHPAESARRMGARVEMNEGQLLKALQGVSHPSAHEQHALLSGERPSLDDTVERLGAVMVQQHALSALPSGKSIIDAASLLRVSP
jgi:NitT/TauT family transport system substrate-binding protein